MTEAQRAEFFAMRKALDGFVGKIAENPMEINDNMAVIRPWKPGQYKDGSDGKPADVRMYDGIPYKCAQSHDSTVNLDWTPDRTPALWTQYHGTSKATARHWVKPTGAHDMYKAGEWMIWTDGLAYPCLFDTAYGPDEYAGAWGVGEAMG